MISTRYNAPLGDMVLASQGDAVTGVWFVGQKHCPPLHEMGASPVLDACRRWLDIYFSGRQPDFFPQIQLVGTPFQLSVWEALRRIPYGTTVTYGELARSFDPPCRSAQAVGQAVGRNPVSILVPCHRVLGADGTLTGYAGGIERKRALLAIEGIFISQA